MPMHELPGRHVSLFADPQGPRGAGMRPLVLLNGLSQSTANWMTHVRAWRDTRPTLAYDARGQGRSELGGVPYDLGTHIDDLAALLDLLGIGEVDLCGFSHGARVALGFAARHPGRVGRLVLTSTGADGDARRVAIVTSWRHVLRLGGIEALAWASLPTILGSEYLATLGSLDPVVRATVQRNRAEGLEALLAGMERYGDALEDAARVTAPSLLITSDDDPLVAPAAALRLAQVLGARHERWQGAGHTLPIERPEAWRSVVEGFLTGR
jgi:pimeloyl-ACP methyl ester carboxylesterase